MIPSSSSGEARDIAYLFWFSDEQRARIAPLLPKNTRGFKRVDSQRQHLVRRHVHGKATHEHFCSGYQPVLGQFQLGGIRFMLLVIRAGSGTRKDIGVI